MTVIGTRFFAIILALLMSGAVGHAAPSERAEARIEQGQLAGVIEGGVHVFRGIPYARPPVGDLRWRPPAPPEAWKGTRNAAAFGASCVQPPYPQDSVYYEQLATISEDCLTLNVWAPKQAKGAPVIVWIHGGALMRGTSGVPMYDGAEYAKRGIVFISINYRLGVLGWLAHPGLSAESPEAISGNYGLLDQIAALGWVRRNAAAFGGDAANVTVMGESAGAFSITYLLASPRAQGLFGKAIVQSTNMRAVPHLREPAFGLPPAEEIGAALGGDIAALRALDAETLVNRALAARFVSQGTIDGAVLPAQVVDIFDRGEQAKVPVLAGFNSGEVRTQRALVPAVPADAEAYKAEVVRRFGDLAPAYLALYPASDMEGSLLAATRDIVYGWSSERLVRQQAAAGLPAFLYYFDHCPAAARARDLCAFHASELPFTFGRAGADAGLPPNWPATEAADDQLLADAMIAYWVEFARSGNPGGTPNWSPYGPDRAYMLFAGQPEARRDLLPGMFDFHERRFRQQREKGQQWFLN